MNRLKEFRKAYKQAVVQIKKYLNDPVMYEVTNWLLTAETDLFSALPKGWGNLYSAQDCETLLGTIHHALVDDGEISFPVVRGEPRIAFVSQWETNVDEYILTDAEKEFISQWETNVDEFILTDAEKEFKQRFGMSIEITFLNTIQEFISARTLWEANKEKQYFVADAARFGIEFAKKHYPKVTDEQVQQWRPDIEAQVARLNLLR